MSTGDGMVPLVPRVGMRISYFWGGKTQCDIEQIKEEKKGKDSNWFNQYLFILVILTIYFPYNLSFNNTQTDIQKNRYLTGDCSCSPTST